MKKTVHLLLGLILFPLAVSAQSLPKAEEAYAKGDYTAALAQYEQILQTATGEDRLQAQLRKAACQYNLGEYMNAAKTILGYELPANDLWKARFLLYRIQTAEQVVSVYPLLMNEREIASEDGAVSLEQWTQAQWNAQIDQDYETLWALRAALINAPVEKETLILNLKDTDTRRIPTLFDFVVYNWAQRLKSGGEIVPLARAAAYTYLDGAAKPVPAQQAKAGQLAHILETAYLLDGKGRQNAKIIWRTEFILLPFDNPSYFTLENKEKALQTAVEQLKLISGYTPQKLNFWSKLKGYVSPEDTGYGHAYAAYRTAQLLKQNDDPADALKLCEYGQTLEESYYTLQAGQLAKEIVRKELSFGPMPAAFNPQKARLPFTVRNAGNVYVRVYKTSFEELQTLYRRTNPRSTINSWDFLSRLDRRDITKFLDRAPFKTASAQISYQKPYRSQKVSVSLPELDNGFYVALASWDESFDMIDSPVLGVVINATDLALFVTAAIEDNPDKYTATLSSKTKTYRPNLFRFYTVNLKTGMPERNAKLDVITAWNGTREKASTGADGTAALARAITVSPAEGKANNTHFVNALAEKEGNLAYTPSSVYFHFYANDPVRLYAQTDRAIYRPGQKVQLAVNAFETLPRGLKVLPGRRVQIKVTSPSGDTVFSASPLLNAMGTAGAEMTLPDNPMLGHFQIAVSVTVNGRTYRTYDNFQVEDFKRPDYELTLAEPEKALEYGKTAAVRGHAQYYFGTPLQEATVKYTVSRQDYVPPFYWWWTRILRHETTQVAQGETRTDDKGDFKIEFTPAPADKDEQFTQYIVKAEAYDDSGRAISASRTYKISAQPKLFKVEFSQGFYDANAEASSLAQIDLTDADGRSVSGKVTVRAARLENVLPQDEQSKADEYFNPNNRSSLETIYRNAQEEAEAFTKELNFKTPGAQTLALPALPEGVYRLTVKADKADTQQMIFVVAQDQSALQLPAVTLVQHAKYYPGETARILLGAGALTGSKRVEVSRGNTFLTRKELLPGGVSVYSFPVEQEERGGVGLTWFGASNYAFHEGSATVQVPFDNKELGVVIDVPNAVRPGETAAWKLTAKDATGSPVQGQASVTVYDKSLDYYAKKNNPFTLDTLFPQTAQFVDRADSALTGYASVYYDEIDQPFYAPPQLPTLNLRMPRRFYGALGGALYSTRSAMAVPQMAMAKSANTIQAAAYDEGSEFYEEGVEYAADRGAVDEADMAMALSAETQESAAEETAGTEKAVLRTDFSETAYFNPALPLVNGQASVRLTMPQSLTAWNILGFVLTKNADFGAFSAQTVTRKDFMVRLQMPRFYREGDKGVLQAAVTNLTSKKLSADVEITVKKDNASANDAFGIAKAKKTVSVGADATQFVTWNVTVPADPALYSITVTARSGKNSDGEQKTLPVFPGKERLLATANIALKNGMNELKLTELENVSDAELQTAALTLNPSLALSVLNSMPNLLSSPYKDLVSSLNRYVPLAVVNKFYTAYPQLKNAVSKLPKRTGLTASWNESDPLRLTLLEQTPWLRQAQGQQVKEADIIDLFNPQIVSDRQAKELAQIAKFQNESGAFAWFPGGQDDDYLTLYALNAFAQALSYNAEIPQDAAQKAFAYIRPRIEKRLQQDRTGSESAVAYALYAAYTLSAFPQSWAQTAEAKPYIQRWADYADQQSRFMTALGQTYAAAVYHRLGDDVKANRYLDLVLSRMKQNDLTGAYFAPEPQSWVWYRDTLTTQTITLRTILELRPQSDKIDAMTQWLLFNRQVNDWTDSKAAAQAVFTLLDVMKHKGALSLPVQYTVTWAGETKNFSFEPFDWTEDLQFVRRGRQVTPEAFSAQIQKKGVMTDFASLSLIYKSAEAKASPKGVINVTRQYFTRFTQDGVQKLRPVQDLGEVKVGDEVEVQLTLTTDSAFEYVRLSDPKPAGFESDELLSGWTADPLWLYRENRDAETNFFINWLPAGTVTFNYVLRPTVEGRFHALPAQAQSMYAPEFGAHTAAAALTVEK